MKDRSILRKSASEGNVRKANVRKFYWSIIVIMIAPALFQGNVLPSVAVAANQGMRAQIFASVTQKCAKH